jgi:hypothetical protein
MINDTGEQRVLLDRVAKGREAEKLKNTSIYAQAKLTAANRIFDDWANTEVTQQQEREALWHEHRALKRESLALEQIIQEGKMAALRLQQMSQLSTPLH